jgi:hypothetical protein
MGRFGSFVTGVIVGASSLAVATHYHVVRGKDGVFVVRKVQNNLSDIYVDTREFTPADWMEHRMLALAIMQADRGDMLQDSSLDSFRSNLKDFVSGWLEETPAAKK